jgi:hypothetical protein
MRTEIEISDEQIEEIFLRSFGVGLTVDCLDFSREQLENFDKNMNCIERNKPYYDEEQGFRTLEIKEVKTAKGKPRIDVCVVDFGNVRAVYQG